MTYAQHSRTVDAPAIAVSEEHLSYGSYLDLRTLLSAQHPRSNPEHHDEILFIIQHQVSELWFKLMLHELRSARASIREEDAHGCDRQLVRVAAIQRQLYEQWAVIETLQPSEFAQFRNVLGQASGFQSVQYRTIEFILGNKAMRLLEMFVRDKEAYEELRLELECPSLYDELLMYLSRNGHAVPAASLEREWRLPYKRNPNLLPVFEKIYASPQEHEDSYALCERFADIDQHFHLWRFRHLKTVERMIGNASGTGGTTGVAFLRKVLDEVFFPEMIDARSQCSRAM
jgi:tryptophan 2,3-dioxygenase